MANPNIWAPGTSISANGTMKSEAFTAYDGQTEFTLTAFTYAVGTGSLYVFVSGAIQRAGVDFTESAANTFTLTESVPVDTIVYAIAFTSIVADIPVIDLTPAAIGPSKYFKTDASGTIFEYKTAGGVLADIGAEPADSSILKSAAIGVTVQAYDADTAKLDVDQTWTGSQRTTPVTDADANFDMSAGNDFLWTPSGADTLEFSNEVQGQRGCILLNNTSNYTISLGTEIDADATCGATLSATGKYWISYWCYDGTNVAISYSKALV